MTGTHQLSRSIAALRPETVRPDSRTPRQLIAQVVERAALYRFYDTRDQAAGDWSTAYAQVPLVRYARLAEWNLRPEREWIEGALVTLTEANDDQAGVAPLGAQLVTKLTHGFARVEEERRAAFDWPAERAFVAGLEELIRTRLAPAWQCLRQCREEIARRWPAPVRADRTEPFLSSPAFEPSIWGDSESTPRPAKLRTRDGLHRELGSVVTSLFSGLELIVTQAQRLFDERLAAPSGLPPPVALYAAFVQQFGSAQKLLNELPRRHRDHYFREILGAKPEGPRPDRVFLAFSPASENSFALLPEGTELLAGKNAAGAPLYYRTDSAVRVQGSISIVHADTLPSLRLLPTAAAMAERDALTKLTALAAPRVHFQASQRAHRARGPGFVFAHPVLLLGSGRRVITLTVSFEPPATPPSTSVPEPAFPGLVFDYTAAEGWHSIPADLITVRFLTGEKEEKGTASDRVQWTLVLSPTMPALVAADSAVYGRAGWDSLPALRCRWFEPEPLQAPVRATDLWTQPAMALLVRRVSRIHANVATAGITALELSGPEGELAPEAPFAPFGATPVRGAFFEVGCPELADKTVNTLSLTFHWQNLPLDRTLFPQGLRSYFADYLAAISDPNRARFDHREYRVVPEVGAGGTWRRVETDHRHLFSGAGEKRDLDPALSETDALSSRSRWRFKPQPAWEELRRQWVQDAFAAAPFSPRFRLQLDIPDESFGQPLYAEVVETVATRNAKLETAGLRSQAAGKQAFPLSLSDAFHCVTEPARRGFWRRWWFPNVAADNYALVLDSLLFRRLEALRTATPELALRARELDLSPERLLRALAQIEGRPFHGLAGLAEVFVQHLGAKAGESAQVETLIRWLARLLGSLQLSLPQNLPLTPRVAQARLAYTASALLTDAEAPDQSGWWHWDGQDATPARAGDLLYAPVEDDYLYLAFRGIEPDTTLSLLVVIEAAPLGEGVSISTPEERTTSTVWQGLRLDGWKTLGLPGAIHDGTGGFTRTGLVTWEISPDLLPPAPGGQAGCAWLRIKATAFGRETVAVRLYLHGAVASRVLGTSPEGSVEPLASLPAGSIRTLRTADPRIKGVLQPLASFGGLEGEDEERFATRVAEDLRHKGRAVTLWDFERWVLARHPSVFFARALPPVHSTEAGGVTLVVAPVRRMILAGQPPAFTRDELQLIWNDLMKRASPNVQITVANPLYDRVRVIVQVAFSPDRTFQHYAECLSAELDAFIAPWVFTQTESSELVRVEGFSAEELAAFISSRTYVERLGNCEVRVVAAGRATESGALAQIAPSSPRALLLPAARHEITVWTES